jgi:osmotically-inducible protein OsmY
VKLSKQFFTVFMFAFFAAHAVAAPAAANTNAPTTATEGAGEYMDDALITTKVKAAIVGEPTLKATSVKVETNRGTVRLSGYVGSKAEADKATEVTQKVKGVTSVTNDLMIKQ